MILPVFSRRPIVGHSWVAAATMLTTGLVGFAVWLHHMFATGGRHGAMAFFSAASMILSIFRAVQFAARIPASCRSSRSSTSVPQRVSPTTPIAGAS